MTDEKIMEEFMDSLGIPDFTSYTPTDGINALSDMKDLDDPKYSIAVGLYGESLRGDFEVIESVARLLNLDKYGAGGYESVDFSDEINGYFESADLQEPDLFDLAKKLVTRAEEKEEIYTCF